MLTFNEYIKTLKDAGIQPGDIVHIQSNLRRIGFIEGMRSRKDMLEFYLKGLQEVLGPEGTISCFSMFTDFQRYGKPYIAESSPCNSGDFANFLLQQKEVVRSMHPVMSVAALGAKANMICGGTHYSAYGYDSPWRRLHHANAKILSLGLGTRPGGSSFLHYIEASYGVPYQYTKLIRGDITYYGKSINEDFYMAIRYLNYDIQYNTTAFKKSLIPQGIAKELQLGGSFLYIVDANAMFNAGIAWLNKNIYGFLNSPPQFIDGQIPCDGITANKERVLAWASDEDN
tara:strand:- start:4487 stop:5344 length:858 start_codon:yes stop_codon:yes gene_type:complete